MADATKVRRFRLQIPMWTPNESGECSAVSPDGDTAVRPREPWLLLVDDDPVAARSIARWVSLAARVTVFIAHDSEQAESWLRKRGAPVAVVCDFELADGATGVGTIQHLRGIGCSAPAAMLTGAPDAALRALSASGLDEVVPVFSKTESGSRLKDWLDPLRLFWAETA
jgi:CheY-like chemotaxis protein